MSAYRVCQVVYRVYWVVYQVCWWLGGTWTLIGEHYIGGVQCQCLTEEARITWELPYNACYKNYTTPRRLRRSSDPPHKYPRPSNFFRAVTGLQQTKGRAKTKSCPNRILNFIFNVFTELTSLQLRITRSPQISPIKNHNRNFTVK